MFFISTLTKQIFGSRNQRVIRRSAKLIEQINKLEPHYEKLSAEQLQTKTQEFKTRYQQGETLENLLAEAFATVREASKRTLNMRHFDVQLMGGIILHQGKIAEMCTGEGKTLVATLPAYLNAIAGKGVHIITVNDYLAKRDAEWMGPIYQYLGLTIGVNLSNLSREEKQKAYQADITYGTNNEFGFDYLRDNMVFSLSEKVQRDLSYAIIDEVDSILIDEARTPLIISGQAEDATELYIRINALIPKLTPRETEDGAGDYYLEEKHRQAFLTEDGHRHVEKLMLEANLLRFGESLYDAKNITLMHHINAALRAHKLYHSNVEYIVKNNEIIIIDEHTGRTMPGRRWSDGLHQAIEAKEGVTIRHENQTLATITFQNLFRLYDKLAGMTGTADTEAYELQHIYNLEVIVIPTNRPLIRKDHADKIYLTTEEKFNAIIQEIKECSSKQQPILVGTASIETSEDLSRRLTQEKISHQVLNAKYHEQEAKIIAQAGQPSAVTIATNMAGRGTDIVLGGNLEAELAALAETTEENIAQIKHSWQKRHNLVIDLGGLHVLGTERHESRRIDNQLRGRSGRQGDPGSSRFYVSLQDNLMRIFASDRVSNIMRRLGMGKGESLEHRWITKAIENAQRRVENHHFDVRKHLLEFDNVANDQRKVIYQQRNELMKLENISEMIDPIRDHVITRLLHPYIPEQTAEEMWNLEELNQKLESYFGLSLSLKQWLENKEHMDESMLHDFILENMIGKYQEKEAALGSNVMRQLEKSVMLQVLDTHWKEHLANIDHLRHTVHLMGYAQRDPKQEYKRESFHLFSNMLENIKFDAIQILSTIEVRAPDDVALLEEQRRQQTNGQQLHFHHDDPIRSAVAPATETAISAQDAHSPRRTDPKIGRNAPCPCGSGKKYKHCCGQLS